MNCHSYDRSRNSTPKTLFVSQLTDPAVNSFLERLRGKRLRPKFWKSVTLSRARAFAVSFGPRILMCELSFEVVNSQHGRNQPKRVRITGAVHSILAAETSGIEPPRFSASVYVTDAAVRLAAPLRNRTLISVFEVGRPLRSWSFGPRRFGQRSTISGDSFFTGS
jgi:hypothetical protein